MFPLKLLSQELMVLLSDYDPDCQVEVLKSESEWIWDGENSIEKDIVGFDVMITSDIKLNKNGEVRIGSCSYE